MYKKVLVVLVVCFFMVSNVCFAMPITVPAPNSAVKNAVDNIAIESALAGNKLTPQQAKNIAEMFNSIASADVNGMWSKILTDLDVTTDAFIAAVTSDTKTKSVIRTVNRTENSITFINGKKRYVSESDGKIVLSDKKPGGDTGLVAQVELTDSEKAGLSEAEQEQAAKAKERAIRNERWSRGELLDSEEKVELKQNIVNHITVSDTDNVADKDTANAQIEKVFADNGISKQAVLDMFDKMPVKRSEVWADANGNYHIGYGEGRSGSEKMIIPTEDEMGNPTDLAFHEICEALGLDHATIRKIQKAVDKIKGDSIGEETTKVINDLMASGKKEAKAAQNNIVDNLAKKIDTEVARSEDQGLTPSKTSEKIMADSAKIGLGDEAIAASGETELTLGTAAVNLKLTKGLGRLFGLQTLKEFSIRPEQRDGENDSEKVLAIMEWISALGNSDAQIPFLEETMFGELDDEGEIKLTDFSTQLLAAMQGAKLKENASVYAFNGGARAMALAEKLNTIVGYDVFKFYEGDEAAAAKAAGIEGEAITRTHVMHTDISKQDEKNQKLIGAQYHYIGVDINKLNGLALFSAILQGKKTEAINKVLTDIASGNFEMLPPEFVLTDEMRFKIEVAKAVLEQA